ncbi:MAG TPA: hypothetical protein VFP36_13635 [Usitatibacter sp.]|nr:hypothetical protein [Usitatibacter sp.]
MKRLALAALAAASFATPLLAADPPVPPFPPERFAEDAHVHADAWKRWADDFSREMRASMSTMFAERVGSSRVVKGSPYSARVVTEVNQPLADGNMISHRHEGAVYRDGGGRTRQETAAEGRRTSIVIDDPVEDKHYVLLPDFKRAIETHGARKKHAHAGKEAGSGGGSGSEVVVRRFDGHETADGLPREEVVVKVVRAGEDARIPVPPIPPIPPTPPVPPVPGDLASPPPMPPMPPIPGIHTMRFENMARLGKGVTTSLGTKEFDGVRAEGKQTVWTIPAGEIGNRKPIQVTSESWYSPELQVTVYSRYNDPRTGETVYRLAAIRRAEPAAELFRVPADYQVRQRGR